MSERDKEVFDIVMERSTPEAQRSRELLTSCAWSRVALVISILSLLISILLSLLRR